MKIRAIVISLVGFVAAAALFLFSDNCSCPLCIVKGEPPMPCGCVKEYAYLLGRAGFHQFNSMACGRQRKPENQAAAHVFTFTAHSWQVCCAVANLMPLE